jgi:hypothetical protein
MAKGYDGYHHICIFMTLLAVIIIKHPEAHYSS